MEFIFLGNALWVDLLNTQLDDGTQRYDLLPDFGALLQWAAQAGAISSGIAQQLRTAESVISKNRSFQLALGLRADLRASAERMIQNKPPPAPVITKVNQVLLEHPRFTRLSGRGDRWKIEAEDLSPDAGVICARVAEDFAQFMVNADWSLLRRCEKSPCCILFYDTSRTGVRRWCSMKICGNRSKVARHRARVDS